MPSPPTDTYTYHHKKYQYYVQLVYIVAAVLWLLLLCALNIFSQHHLYSHYVLVIPLIVYAIGFSSVDGHLKETEREMSKYDYLSLALIFITLYIQWKHRTYKSHSYIRACTIAALVLILLSIIDVWVPHRAIIVSKHIRSALQTAGVTLLLYVILMHAELDVDDGTQS